MYQPNGDFLPHVRLSKDLLDITRYDKRVRPTVDYVTPTKVSFSMSLYQILAIVRIDIRESRKQIVLERKNATSRVERLGDSEVER